MRVALRPRGGTCGCDSGSGNSVFSGDRCCWGSSIPVNLQYLRNYETSRSRSIKSSLVPSAFVAPYSAAGSELCLSSRLEAGINVFALRWSSCAIGLILITRGIILDAAQQEPPPRLQITSRTSFIYQRLHNPDAIRNTCQQPAYRRCPSPPRRAVVVCRRAHKPPRSASYSSTALITRTARVAGFPPLIIASHLISMYISSPHPAGRPLTRHAYVLTYTARRSRCRTPPTSLAGTARARGSSIANSRGQ